LVIYGLLSKYGARTAALFLITYLRAGKTSFLDPRPPTALSIRRPAAWPPPAIADDDHAPLGRGFVQLLPLGKRTSICFAGLVAMLYRTDGPNEVVRFEGDYRPRQVDSADVVAPETPADRGRAAVRGSPP
jgi:hypothetical protein